MAELSAFGTVHVDRPSKAADELEEISDGADVLFVEKPREALDFSDAVLLVRNPAIWLMGRTLNLIWGVCGVILTGQFKPVDGAVVDRVAQDRGLTCEPVDLNIARRASEVSLVVTVVSWVWFVIAVGFIAFGVVVWVRLGDWTASLGFVIFGIALGFVLSVPLAYLTLSDRDEAMAENIEKVLSTDEDLERGCLVVGRGHLDGVVERLKERDIRVNQVHRSKFFRYSLVTSRKS